MALNQNQFTQGPVAGQVDLQTNPNPSVMTMRFDPTEATETLSFGEGVQLVDLGANDGAGPPIVAERAADTDDIFGIRIFTTKKGSVEGGDILEVAFKGAVVFMTASAALNRGVKVTLDTGTPGQVKAMGTAAEFGILLDKAGASGDLVRVWITADGFTEGTT